MAVFVPMIYNHYGVKLQLEKCHRGLVKSKRACFINQNKGIFYSVKGQKEEKTESSAGGKYAQPISEKSYGSNIINRVYGILLNNRTSHLLRI